MAKVEGDFNKDIMLRDQFVFICNENAAAFESFRERIHA